MVILIPITHYSPQSISSPPLHNVIRIEQGTQRPLAEYLGDYGLTVVSNSSKENYALSSTSSSTIGVDIAKNQATEQYALMYSKVIELTEVQEEMEEDEGASVPTLYAIRQTIEILQGALENIYVPLPKAAFSVSYEGGIRIQWMYPQFSLRLVIAEAEESESYIYYEDGQEYSIEAANSENLKQRLMWLKRKLSDD